MGLARRRSSEGNDDPTGPVPGGAFTSESRTTKGVMATEPRTSPALGAAVPQALSAPPGTPPEATHVFGDRLPLAEQFVAILADTGIAHGLIGPREAPRLWDRHVMNCAVAQGAIPRSPAGERRRLIDVGSGAGLPGLALALARPDLEVHLVEPLARRTGWLSSTVTTLGVENVVVHTSRAEDLWGRISAPYVCARAVSNIRQLASWSLPLLEPRGSLLALKGAQAQRELDQHRAALTSLGVVGATVERYAEHVREATTVVRLTIGETIDVRRFARQSASSSGSARRRGDRSRATGTSRLPTSARRR